MSFLDIIILAILIFGLWQGFQAGLIRSLASLFGWLFALVFATFFAKPLSPLFAGFFDSPVATLVASFVILAISVVIVLQVVLWIIGKTLQGLKLSFLDKLAGAGFGVCKNLLAVLLIISVVAPFAQYSETWKKSLVAPMLVPLTPFAVDLSKKMVAELNEGRQKSFEVLDKASQKTSEKIQHENVNKF